MALIGWSSPLEAASVRVKVSVQPTTITEVDLFQLDVSINGPAGAIEWPEFKQTGFVILGEPSISQRVFNDNGRVSRSITASYQARPTRAGVITIPRLTVKVNGKPYTSRTGARITVHRVKQLDNIFMKLSATPESVYPEQWFKVQLKIYAREGTGSLKNQPPFPPRNSRDPWPKLTISWLKGMNGLETTDSTKFLQNLNPSLENVGFPINNLQNRTFFNRALLRFPFKRTVENRKARDGKEYKYFVFTLERQFRGLEPGDYTFAPVVARGKVVVTSNNQTRRGQWREVTTKSNSLTVKVKDVPRDNRPASYSGAVGRFQVRATVKPDKVGVGEPMTLHVDVRGTGKLEPIAPLALKEQEGFDELFRIQEPDTGEIAENRQSKKFVYSLRPTKAGIEAVPPVAFSYFDPIAEAFKVVKTQPLPITVDEGNVVDGGDIHSFTDGSRVSRRRQIQAVEDAIWPVYNKPDALIAQVPVARPSLWQLMLLAGPPILYLALLMTTLRRRKLNADPGILRARGASRKARETLSVARAAAEAEQATDVYQEIARAVSGFIADRLNRPAAGMTPMDVLENLEKQDVPEDLRQWTTTLLDACEHARYGAPNDAENLVEEVRRATDLIEKLEGRLR
jgi:hypothetical protein